MSIFAIPSIESAGTLAKACGAQQIVIWLLSETDGESVVTWGEPLRHSLLAAEAGNHVKKAAGWAVESRQELPQSLLEVWRDVDTTAAAAIQAGLIDKGHALTVLHLVRDAVATRDPKLGEKLIAQLCEAAEAPAV
jgi:hypothetical protein